MVSRFKVNISGEKHRLSFDRYGTPPLVMSAATRWAGLPFEVHRIGSLENIGEVGPMDGECGLLIIMDGQLEYVVRERGREVPIVANPGTVSVMSGERRPQLLRITGEAIGLALHVPRSWFARLEGDELPDDFALARPTVRDETVHGLARAMWREVARDASTGRVFGESLSLAMLSYLSARLPWAQRRHISGRLTDAQSRSVTEFIHDQLHTDLSVMSLAGLVGLGPRRFSTLFRQTFGETPHRYIVELRLREGARMLHEGEDIADVARKVGFCSQSHFTAAFREAFGTTPRRYAKSTPEAEAEVVATAESAE
ncbi:MAG TPA: AraC family transcriptional regulator [Polyangiales bacterium]|nr:AraC family transcriptional regulator [Polyangiales bacterium]